MHIPTHSPTAILHKNMEGYLVIENGTVMKGTLFGVPKETHGELVFNTSMTGYQEILYDPSYRGQIVVMTYPLIGNYGINEEDVESSRTHLAGFVVKERAKTYSNWQAKKALHTLFEETGICGIEGLDTRRITLMLRDEGALKGGLFPPGISAKEMITRVKNGPGLIGVDLVKEVIRKEPWWWNNEGSKTVVVMDCGVKYNILRLLAVRGFRVRVVPADYPLEEILKERPDGILLSNGPGDPAALPYVVKTASGLVERFPLFGICLGHQILGQVFGGKTYKLKFGHHGANHPVQDVKSKVVYITAQNHGFCVDIETLKDPAIEMTHINLNDKTLEGIRHRRLPVFSIQFHPEASPGPREAMYLFDTFAQSIHEKN